MKIKKIVAREILDSRGNPTLTVTVHTKNYSASASVPSGASTGTYEAVELRDGDLNRFGGRGVKKALNNVNNTIASAIIGLNPLNQKEIVEDDVTLSKSSGVQCLS